MGVTLGGGWREECVVFSNKITNWGQGDGQIAKKTIYPASFKVI